MGVVLLDLQFERVDVTYERPTVRTGPEKAVQVRQRSTSVVAATGEAQVRVWRASSSIAPQAEYDALRAAWDASKGGVLPIDWQPPDEGAALEVFLDEVPPPQAVPGLWRLEARMREVVR